MQARLELPKSWFGSASCSPGKPLCSHH